MSKAYVIRMQSVLTLVLAGILMGTPTPSFAGTRIANEVMPIESMPNGQNNAQDNPQDDPQDNTVRGAVDAGNVMDELDPFSPDVEKKLEAFDKMYEQSTNKSSWMREFSPLFRSGGPSCYRATCAVYAYVRRSEQKMYLYLNGSPYTEWLVSTGAPGHDTPDFDRHPNGRIYDEYSSLTFPGGNYQGLGNMPYAVFIEGGFAVHGTGKSNWRRLGSKASHGCIRLHPDNAMTFNRLVRQYGVSNVWIQVSE